MAGFTMEMDGLREYAQALEQAAGNGLREDLRTFIDTVGMKFLQLVQDQIHACKAVVSGLLINSFGKGGPDNIWEESDGGLTLDVGSGVEYAAYVNDGHHTTPAGVPRRWVPGSWAGDKFVYSPGSEDGMLLKRKWVNGHHFWEASLRQCEPVVEKCAMEAVEAWIQKYFA